MTAPVTRPATAKIKFGSLSMNTPPFLAVERCVHEGAAGRKCPQMVESSKLPVGRLFGESTGSVLDPVISL